MTMPPVDLARTSPTHVCVQCKNGVWTRVRREVVQRAQHNAITYGSGNLYGTPVDEQDCNDLLGLMRGAS